MVAVHRNGHHCQNNKHKGATSSSIFDAVFVVTQIAKAVVAVLLAVGVVFIVVECNPHRDLSFYFDQQDMEGASPSSSNQPYGAAEYIIPMPTLRKKQKDKNEFVITFLGDTMFQNTGYNWETTHYGKDWNPADGFKYIKPMLDRTDYLILNLEGPITELPITVDPKPRTSFNYSFSMHPRVTGILKETLGVDAVNMANNHQSDRNMQGWLDTKDNLDRYGIKYFGTGLNADDQAEPLMIEVGETGTMVAITGFMDAGYCCDELPIIKGNIIDYVPITFRPTPLKSKWAAAIADKRGATYKIAFVHWLTNYASELNAKVLPVARNLANAGFDVIIGSDGSHTVKEFDFITDKKVPCFYDIGNFVFQKWGKFRTWKNGKQVLPYGTVTHLVLDNGVLDRMEIHCTLIDNNIVHYKPRPCNPAEAKELFTNLGPHLDFRNGDTFAMVDLKKTTQDKKWKDYKD